MIFLVVTVALVAALLRVVLRGRRPLLHVLRCRLLWRLRTLDQLVELAAIQPDAAALRTVVDLDALTIAHVQIDAGANGTFHDGLHGCAINRPYCSQIWIY